MKIINQLITLKESLLAFKRYNYICRLIDEDNLQLQACYQELIRRTAMLLKVLEVKTSVDVCSAFSSLYSSGFLSYSHDFSYFKEPGIDFLLTFSNCGAFIAKGMGDDQNLAFFLTDLLQNLSIDSLTAITNYSINEKVTTSLDDLFMLGTNFVNYIREDEATYIFNPSLFTFGALSTSQRFYYLDNPDQTYPLFFRYHLQPRDKMEGIILSSLKTDQKEMLVERFEDMQAICYDNRYCFERFYQDNKELYYDINQKIDTINEKYIGFIKR